MFNPSPYFPGIHLPDVSHSPYLPSQIIPNMDIEAVMQMHAAALAERRARRISEDEKEDDEMNNDLENDDNWDHHDRRDIDHDMGRRRDHAYREEDQPFLRRSREQDDLEISYLERVVVEANRTLEDAKQNLMEAKMRIRDRRREERRQLKERSRLDRSIPRTFVDRTFADDAYGRASQPMRDYLAPTGNRSRPPTPQPSTSSLPTRSRSPSPYRFSSRAESEIPQSSQSSQSKQEPRSRTPDPTARKDGTASSNQEYVYQSFSKIHDLAKEFQTLKQNFVYPSAFEFQKPGSKVGEVIIVRARSPPAEFEDDESISDSPRVGSEARKSEGKLAYTRANEGFHTYAYSLEKLLGKLDSVDSWNETSVRSRRRGIVGEIEQEASKLERYRQKVWRDYLAEENVKMYRS